ncbi:hypothetical protein BaRGS_00004516 [Batillaria attramentaria]|uniref:Bromodomain adjacent to zinc finger domain protein 1A n=1 Tax=Batillaria attramentaria TaxID=370345 RepID=A0ABD0LXJ1_9CAEN
MPLLRKQPFHKQKPPIDLSPDEEVFHCKITNEIFRDYEAFFERIILCNSLVWSCAITGRSGMTYQEAVECEEKAKRHLATFQDSLQRPLLFLATLTHRSRLVDLNDDVFLFAKDRYFIGETVDVTLPGEAKRAAKILRVVLPGDTKTNGDIIVIDEDSDSEEENKKEPPHPHKMKYVVQFTSSKAPPVTVTANQVNRKKGLYTRDKSKLFLKQHCEPIDGLWKVKEEKLRKSNLKTAKFLDFFAGPPPVFTVSVIKKKQNFKKNADAGKSTPVSATPDRTNASTSATNSPQDSAVPSPQSSSLLTPKERAAQKEQAKQDKLAEKMEREKKREERRKQIEKLKEWSRPREDMECDDLKPLPEFSEVKTRLPAAVFGDALMVLEYITAFKSVFDFKQFFPKGFTWAQLEAALVNPDPQGPLCDLIQMLLWEEEQAEEDDNNMSNNELLRSATIMAQVSQQTFGMPLRDTLLDQFTLTEVLRLHLMSSGARANSKNARFRYQQRGGYTSLDDPGLELRKQHPGLLRKLNNNNIFDLQPDDKVRLVMTLVQQVMSYAAVRDIVEESFDKLRVKKYDLKLLQWAEVRREREDAAAKYRRLMEERLKERERRLQQAAKAAEERCGTSDRPSLEQPIPVVLDDDSFETPEERQKREDKEKAEEAKKKADYAKRELDMLQQIQELQRTNALYPLGRDRLYRRYWLLGAVPAVLVEDHELFLSGMPSSTTVSEETGEMMPTLIRQDDHNTSSDKENEVSGAAAANDSGGSGPVSNSGSAENGDCIVISDEEGEAASKAKAIPTMEMDEPPKLDSHPAHQSGSQRQEPRWYVLDSKTCLDQLMDSLNPRGFRESVLQTAIQEMRPLLNLTIDTCPLDALRAPPEGEEKEQPAKPHVHTRSTAPRIVEGTTQTDSASEAIELTLRDALLDLDDRIFVGSLGALKVKDRAAWRAALESGGYSPQTDELPFAQLENKENSEGNTSVSEEVVAKHMAYALAQIARGVEPRFLRSPLGEETEDKKKVHKEEKQDDGKEFGRRRIFERWEESVLAATSLSQVFLHLAAFDKSVKWDRSALMARCRICRRKGDAEKMLLCDGCDRGHHMYCLKPPKTKVPSGDWFCSNCQPKQPQPSPRKNRRRTFSEVSDDEEAEESLKLQETIEEARQDGKLILCDVCPRSYHLHCARPPLKKVPRGKWMCQVCVGGNRAGKIQIGKPKANSSIKEKKESKTTPSSKSGKSSSSRPGSRRETPRNSPTPTSTRGKKQERSANREVTPKVKGHSSKDVTPKSRGHSDRDSTPKSWDSEKDGLGKLKRSSSSASRLSQDSSDFETSARHYTSSTRGNTTVQQMKLCEDLLQELIRHQDAWPFLKPVDKKLVPDYYDVIESPMDLSTIRNKVHKFEYDAPIQLLDDVRLIFNNCIEYNARNTPEYRAGQTLGRFFHGRLRDLGIQDETSTPPPPAKKQRR